MTFPFTQFSIEGAVEGRREAAAVAAFLGVR
jgi:hypothetical protein